jgi:hypothetical protein
VEPAQYHAIFGGPIAMGVILTGLWHAIVLNPLKAVKAMVTGKK